LNTPSPKKQKLLYICHRIPYPPNKGDKIRSYNFLKFLSEKYDVYLAFLIDYEEDIQYIAEVAKYAKEIAFDVNCVRRQLTSGLVALSRQTPLSVGYFHSKKLQSCIHSWVEEHKFKTVLVFSSSMAQYVLTVPGLKKVMDFCDVDSEKWYQYARDIKPPMSWLYKTEGRLLRRYERKIGQEFDLCLFVSEAESQLFERLLPGAKRSVIRNGIDFQYYNGKAYNFQPQDVRPKSPYIVFTGAMDYKPNVDAVCWFVENALPLIRTKIKDISFCIVGSNPNKHVKRLPGKYPGVFVTGFVNDVRPYVQKAELSVAPLRIARGVQTKILESIALGCPTVATHEAAMGIGIIGDLVNITTVDAKQFATTVLDVYKTRPQQREKIKLGLKTLSWQLTWQSELAKLEAFL